MELVYVCIAMVQVLKNVKKKFMEVVIKVVAEMVYAQFVEEQALYIAMYVRGAENYSATIAKEKVIFLALLAKAMG